MPGPTRFVIEVKQTRTVKLHIWVDGTTVSSADKAAACARAEFEDHWDDSKSEVTGLAQDPPS